MSLGTPGEMTTEKLKATSVDYRKTKFSVCRSNWLNTICQRIYSTRAKMWVRLLTAYGGLMVLGTLI